MRRRHPSRTRELPRRWLMTDPRMGDALWDALAALPRGSGVILRHYALGSEARRALFARVRDIARRRGFILVVGGREMPGGRGTASHGRHRGARTAPAHSRREAITAIRAGAELLFVSPVHPTRSHPGARALGAVRLGLMIRDLGVPVIALGGMDERRWRALRPLDVHGWAGIDAWMRQKRIAVPT
ncbi:thiamine phosphate synthase [Sphingomonas sp. BT-65]|uniref:thiamine phosphate synthase n=1 Tax=Sphingomonas sp. BT-65 TaxID=2989821 RepID=UPI00223590DD|nr:thiamine phosphate synthase [Sphingomonas sp. BT-65]MCW4462383.1 thiamine phosphate synthase [Sphingomonas sp. BT-65]